MNDAMKTGDDSPVCRALARLLAYPDAGLRAQLSQLRAFLDAQHALSPEARAALRALVDSLAASDPYDAQEAYVECFDRGRATSLWLFEHVHGDSRERGQAMVDLVRTYEAAGLLLQDGELPDYLPVVLEFASTQPTAIARSFLSETAPILNALHAALVRRGSRYAAVLGAVLEVAGERVVHVDLPPEEPLDAGWAEPPAFDGCSTAGQSRPGTPQPIHLVRRSEMPAPQVPAPDTGASR